MEDAKKDAAKRDKRKDKLEEGEGDKIREEEEEEEDGREKGEAFNVPEPGANHTNNNSSSSSSSDDRNTNDGVAPGRLTFVNSVRSSVTSASAEGGE